MGGQIIDMQGKSLDELWVTASRLGHVSVEWKTFADTYEAQIAFDRNTGTRVYARARHASVHAALQAVIDEAILLGAIK